MKTVFLTKRWAHHTASGGYDVLAARYPDAFCVRRYPVRSPAAKLARRVWQKLPADESLLDYGFGDFLAEYRALLECARRPVDVVHALYGDEQLDTLLRRRRWLRAKLVATFHLPTESVAERWQNASRALTDRLDAAVVVARSQLDDYRRWFGAERVFYIPHGIDTERFRPPAAFGSSGEGLRLLMVGEHKRDWDTAHRVADFCLAERLAVQIDTVQNSPWSVGYFTACDNVRIHANVPEADLLALYQRADALLLPVTSATANNSVLEAMACGTPVISTDTGGLPDYVDDASGWLFPRGNWQAICELVAAMCRDRALAVNKRAGARARALTFDWQTVVAQTRQLHAQIVAGAPAGAARDRVKTEAQA